MTAEQKEALAAQLLEDVQNSRRASEVTESPQEEEDFENPFSTAPPHYVDRVRVTARCVFTQSFVRWLVCFSLFFIRLLLFSLTQSLVYSFFTSFICVYFSYSFIRFFIHFLLHLFVHPFS